MKLLNPQTADIINGLFEWGGAYGAWRNAFQLYKDRQIKGVYWPLYFWFTGWGLWNLAYYSSLNQPCSFFGGLVLTSGNLFWLSLAIKLRLKGLSVS